MQLIGDVVRAKSARLGGGRRRRDLGLRVARAWAAKELFTKLWTYRYEGAAQRLFKQWFGWVSRSRLEPLIKVATMLESHLENILTYLRHPHSVLLRQAQPLPIMKSEERSRSGI
jgi:hypothetical protein